MTKENIQEFAVALTASPSEGTEAKRNKKTQLLSALLSASALGVFLEGCSSSSGGGGGFPDPVTPDPGSSVTGRGTESNPYLATAAADRFIGYPGSGRDWVSYENSDAGVTILLNDGSSDATVSGGWATGDSLDYDIDNLIGSRFADTLTGDSGANSFEGGRGNDALTGGSGTDSYVFNAGDGTDTITDSGGRIYFDQGTNNDYAGATYTLSNGDLKLTVTKGSETLNVIDFSEIPHAYTFYTRSGDTDTRIPTSSLVIPPRQDGSESNPFLATSAADSFTASASGDWVSYAGSNAGVTIDLDSTATVSGGWAAGDNLRYIDNLIGSRFADTLSGDSGVNTLRGEAGGDSLEGERGNDVLEGGGSFDTYVFNAGDGTDRVIDNGGRIVFDQGANNDYAGATYAFSDVGSDARLTVTKSGRTLNVIEFTGGSSGYSFYTRSDGSDTRISESSFVYPPRQDGSESNPYLATAGADSFSGTGIYDWVSYAGSNAGVNINLDSTATVSGGWAAGDNLRFIDNLIGSRYADTLSGDFSANTLRGGAGNDILNGRGGIDILEGGTGQDDYIFDTSDDTIRSDSDGGRLLFRAADSGNSAYGVARNSNGDVIVTVGAADITIDDSGADDAYQHGSYSIHYGTSDAFFRNLYAGREVADTIVGSSGDDYISGLGGNDKLYGGNGNDEILGGNGNDLLDGGRGDNLLQGGFGDDTYRFDAGTGTDIDSREGGLVLDIDPTGNNKVIFRAPSGVTYTNDNFVFVRGTFSTTASDPFTLSDTGDDLLIVVRTGFGNSAQARNTVLIDDYYFGETSSDDIYSIYRTGYNSGSDGTIVSTQPSELA